MAVATITRRLLREQVSGDLKLRFIGTASAFDAGPPTLVTIEEAADFRSQALAPIASFVSALADIGTTTARITLFDADTGICTLNRDPTTSPIAAAAIEVYSILTPEDWSDLIRRAINSLWFTDRIVLNGTSIPPLSAGISLYQLDDAAVLDWLKVDTQVIKLMWRSQVTGSGSDLWTEEEPVAQYSLSTDGNIVSVLVPSIPQSVTNIELIIEARHYYEDLDDDTDMTTCPVQLARAVVKVYALRKVWALMGEDSAKDMFGQEMQAAERELLDAKRVWVRQVTASPVHLDRVFRGPETAIPASGFRW